MRKPITNLRADKSYLRLDWTYQKKRYILYLGLEDTKTNRLKTAKLQLLIEADMESQTLDITLKKYRNQKNGRLISEATVIELFEKWIEFKSKEWDPTTLKIRSYQKIDLVAFFKDKIGAALTTADTRDFYQWMEDQDIKAGTFNLKLENIQACWRWLKEMGLIENDPWTGLRKLRVRDKPKPDPFTKDEVEKILTGFQESKNHSRFLPFVRFLLGTGCRIGEAAGLTWGDFEDGCVNIVRQFTSGEIKDPKNGKCRNFRIPGSISIMLEELRGDRESTDLIFTTKSGRPIVARDFRAKIWTPILKAAGVRYRRPYNLRHTFCSHSLEAGHSPVKVAAITGHSTQVLFNSYAGCIEKPEAPELF